MIPLYLPTMDNTTTKTALITGASSGIGEELAHILARNKTNLVLTARSEDKLKITADSLEKQYGIKVHVVAADLSETKGVEAVYAYCTQHHLAIDYLINNAGFGDGGDFDSGEWRTYAQMIDLNVKSLTHLCHLFLPQMRARKYGKILNVASIAAFMPGPGMNVYFATKAYVLHFSEALNIELKGSGVSVTALCPGPTNTQFFDTAKMNNASLTKMGLQSVQEVANYGYKSMMRGKRVAIPGLKNSVTVCITKFIPRKWVMLITQKMNNGAGK